jgi:arsenate reductase-like glutaredoxin family protein
MESKIVIYGVKGCIRCTKVLKFMDQHHLTHIFKNLSREKMTPQEISDIL